MEAARIALGRHLRSVADDAVLSVIIVRLGSDALRLYEHKSRSADAPASGGGGPE
jgi:hypothetical protein